MSNPIGLDKLFDFNDTSKLESTIVLIERLNSVYDMLVSQSAKNSQHFSDNLNEILQSAKKLEDQIQDLDATEKAHQETIIKSAAEADKLLKRNELYTKAVKEEDQQIALLIEQQKKLVSAKEKLENANKAEAGSLNDLKDQLKQATTAYMNMGDATDEAIKQDALNKVKALSKAVNDGEQAYKDARKAVDYAAGSYYELNQRVVEAKKRLKEMEGGIGSTSQEFKDLQKFVKTGSDQLKEFDKSIGDNQRNVGNYKEAFEGLDGVLGGAIGRVKTLGTELLKLAANPVVLTLGVIAGLLAAATSAVKTFFETTGEGEDILAEQKGVWDAFFITLRKGWSGVGKSITEAIGPDTMQGFLSAFLMQYAPGLSATFNVTAKAARSLALEIDKLEDLIVVRTISRAETELEVNKRLEASKNKLLFTDQERLDFLKGAVSLQEELSKTEIDTEKQKLDTMQKTLLLNRDNVKFLRNKIEFTQEGLAQLKQEVVDSGLLGTEKQELADQVSKIIGLEAQYFQQQKRNTSQIVALTQEIEKAKRDRINREIDATNTLNKFLLDAEIKRNDEISKDEDASLIERLDAVNNAADARIKSLEIEKQNELNVVQRAAEDRIRAEGKEVTAALLAEDKALEKQRELIAAKYVQLTKDTNQAALDAVENNVFKQLKKDSEELNADTSTIYNEQLRALEQSFQAGNVTVSRLLAQRQNIQANAQRQAIIDQISYLEEQKKLLEQYGHDTSDIDQKISAARLQLARGTSDKTIEQMQRINDAVVSLAAQAFQTASSLINASAQKNIDSLNLRLAAEEEAKNRSIAIVGDDAQAKAFIEEQSAERSKAIQAEINKEKRKAAIYDKAVAITQATVQTALGVARAIGSGVPPLNFILAALTGAAGALQIAAIAAQPIPAFAQGTPFSPEGWALVGEAGREIVRDPSGKQEVVNGPQVRYLAEGSQVIPNRPTEALLRDAALYGDGYLVGQVVGSYNGNASALNAVRTGMETDRIVHALGRTGQQMANAIASQPRDYYDEKGYRRYEGNVGARVLRLDNRYKLQ
jgi:hypothetical protein